MTIVTSALAVVVFASSAPVESVSHTQVPTASAQAGEAGGAAEKGMPGPASRPSELDDGSQLDPKEMADEGSGKPSSEEPPQSGDDKPTGEATGSSETDVEGTEEGPDTAEDMPATEVRADSDIAEVGPAAAADSDGKKDESLDDPGPQPSSEEDDALQATFDENRIDNTRSEHLLVAGGTGVASVIALAIGVGFAVAAANQRNCLQMVLECNDSLEDPIVGEEFVQRKSELEGIAVAADISFVTAGVLALISISSMVAILAGGDE